ncbi:hypothetical protein PoB_003293000 [Plakobranchus ocellatus]|uniref:Uncharacterized protein n=1 Tax=Plakobranchus ocellatus TaxID=259542 RepID=A0AAV4AGC7_9GAST|nr:hypothetical protein PoB_003293000 [Plakobranchus ocellatus]
MAPTSLRFSSPRHSIVINSLNHSGLRNHDQKVSLTLSTNDQDKLQALNSEIKLMRSARTWLDLPPGVNIAHSYITCHTDHKVPQREFRRHERSSFKHSLFLSLNAYTISSTSHPC